MTRVIASRLLVVVPLVFAVATVTFFLGQVSDVDPAEIMLGEGATDEAVAAVREELGLNRSAMAQYGDWLSGAVRGDLGSSLYTGASVSRSLSQAMPVTLSLTFGGLLVGLLVGIPSGLISGIWSGRWPDRVFSIFATIGQAVPNFWLALILIYAFAINFRWFPAVGYVGPTESLTGWLQSIALPSISLGVVAAASISRQTRSALIGVLQLEYIRTALAKGLSRRRVVLRHALKNSAAPVVTVLSFQVAGLLGGAIVVERLFALPGIGSIAIDSVTRRDPHVIQGIVVLSVVVVVLVNLVLDLIYTWLNPKVRPS